MPETPEPPEPPSMAEMARTAGQIEPGDPVAALREHCHRFVMNANITQDARSHALTKLDEMVFWLRSGGVGQKP